MNSFKEKLQQNNLQTKEEKEQKKILEELFSNIKDICMDQAERKFTYAEINVHEELYKLLDDYNEHLFFKNPGAGYPDYYKADTEGRRRMNVFSNPEQIKNYLEKNLLKDGLDDFEFREVVKPLFEVIEWEEENSTGKKLLSGALNLFMDANIDVNTTTRKKRKEIGKQVKNYRLKISWDK